ncbi:uncharacterized protein IL334_004768 [Kwoniella shivajii]|uniref:Uncharacterized protein n=1 Tax=Kwoniella shivajii TaxID=564305 RepID=A0ABZ1D195_9TREE|nr:hypothetical protein IL334_004768 [Kwoniella shivajii]
MMTFVASPTKYTHPALFTGLTSPPMTPITSSHTNHQHNAFTYKPQPPTPSYAMLRSHHAYALKYVIARLRWDQVNNLYIVGQDADWNHDQMIHKLEKELNDVQEAQKGLDKFPNCFAPISFPKPHGPRTEQEDTEINKVEFEREKLIKQKMEEQFPFLKQLFIGPMTKQQARNDHILRENLKEGDIEDLSLLLPSENMRQFIQMQQKRAHPHPHGPPGQPRKSYEQQRYEKEKLKIAAYLETVPKKNPSDEQKKKMIGPLTKEEWIATLPLYGPQTWQEAMLPKQRQQRHDIIRWLQKPWGAYNDQAAKSMETLAEIARKSLEEERISREKYEKRKEEVKKLELQKAVEAKKAEEAKKEDKEQKEGKKEKEQKEEKDAKKEEDIQDGQEKKNEKAADEEGKKEDIEVEGLNVEAKTKKSK